MLIIKEKFLKFCAESVLNSDQHLLINISKYKPLVSQKK